jgi:hypothetical protein
MSDTVSIKKIKGNQFSITKNSSKGRLIGSFTISSDAIYEALEMYQEYLSKQPFNASLKNNSASF